MNPSPPTKRDGDLDTDKIAARDPVDLQQLVPLYQKQLVFNQVVCPKVVHILGRRHHCCRVEEDDNSPVGKAHRRRDEVGQQRVLGKIDAKLRR